MFENPWDDTAKILSKELAQEQEQQGRAEYRIQNTDIMDTGYLDMAFIIHPHFIQLLEFQGPTGPSTLAPAGSFMVFWLRKQPYKS